MDATAGRGFVTAMGDEDHLNFLQFICYINAEGCRHHDCVWESKLPRRLRLCDSFVTCDHMYRPSDLGRQGGGYAEVEKKRLPHEFSCSRSAYRPRNAVAYERDLLTTDWINNRAVVQRTRDNS